MTDNYQIDKNSKLFQKFLNLKNNKATEPTNDKNTQNDSVVVPKPSFKETVQRVEDAREPSRDEIPVKTFGKLQLHMTVSDIEEAAEMSIRDDGQLKVRA